jgi:hypothetical protein
VAEATNFKGLIEKNPTDIEFLSRCSHGAPPKKQSINIRHSDTSVLYSI